MGPISIEAKQTGERSTRDCENTYVLCEYLGSWLNWAPRMRAAHAEVGDDTAALAAAIKRTGGDVAQARMSELERDMQPLAEEIIAAPATSLGGLRAKTPLVRELEARLAADVKLGRTALLTTRGKSVRGGRGAPRARKSETPNG